MYCLFFFSTFQEPTLVNTAVAASTPKARSSVSVSKDTRVLAVRWMSMNACPILAIMMLPAWTRLEGSTASACQVVIETVTLHIIDNWWKINSPGLTSLKLAGYEGVFCHINTDECASQPCLNNGKCVDKINSFHCECPKGENIICDEEKAHEKKQVIRIHLSLLGKTMSSGKNLWKSGSLKQLSLSRACLVLRLVTDLPHPMMSNIFFLLRILTRVSSYWNIWRYEDLCLHLGPKL